MLVEHTNTLDGLTAVKYLCQVKLNSIILKLLVIHYVQVKTL